MYTPLSSDPLIRNYRQFRIRLRRRRLYQGCAFLLLLPTAAAFLPVQGRAPQTAMTLVPVEPADTAPRPIILPGQSLQPRPILLGNFGKLNKASAFPKFPKPTLLSTARHPALQAAVRFPMQELHRLSGLASWYGSVLRGHRTASGERFNPELLTACHRTLPFGTLVRVINLINHRSVLVRINDRGTLTANRVIDLSSAAAEELDMVRSGVAPVRLEVQSPAHPYPVEPTSSAASRAMGSAPLDPVR